MSVGFGMAPDAQGNGTTPDDLQAVLAAQYPEPGIISGCTVSTRPRPALAPTTFTWSSRPSP